MIRNRLRSPLGWREFGWGSALGLALAVAPRPLAAESVRIMAPDGGATLVAGELVEVRWQGLPVDVDEMELLLEVDHTAAVRVRLTPQLAAASRSYAWRVPNLPGRNACLRLRWGRGGVETEGEPSASFAILADPRAPFDGARFHRGEWWIAAAPFSPLELPWQGWSRVLDTSTGRPQPAAAAGVEELEPGSFNPRREPAATRAARRGAARTIRPEVSAHHPLTIPLRP